MHDVLVHYLEVNFPEIAEQLAHARGREPSKEERAAAAERLRELIRRLRREAVEPDVQWHEPRASASELIAGVDGELSPDERKVLDHFFELFARSMERTQAATPPAAPVAEPVDAPAPVIEPAVGPEPATAVAEPTAPSEPSVAPEPEAVIADEVKAEAPPAAAPESPPAPAVEPAPAEPSPARLVPEQM